MKGDSTRRQIELAERFAVDHGLFSKVIVDYRAGQLVFEWRHGKQRASP